MSTWQQELSDEITAIEDVNACNATLSWIITTVFDPESPIPGKTTVTLTRTVLIGADASVDARLVDGKNFVAGDHVCELSYLKYLTARESLSTDPQIISGGVEKSLEDMRPSSVNYGIELGIDTLTIAGSVWKICAVDALDIMNDENGTPVPATLRFTLRK